MKDNILIYVAPIVRLILVLAGGQGAMSEEETAKIIGAVTIIATLAWSIYEKNRGVKKVTAANTRAELAEVKAEVATDTAIKTLAELKRQ